MKLEKFGIYYINVKNLENCHTNNPTEHQLNPTQVEVRHNPPQTNSQSYLFERLTTGDSVNYTVQYRTRSLVISDQMILFSSNTEKVVKNYFMDLE